MHRFQGCKASLKSLCINFGGELSTIATLMFAVLHVLLNDLVRSLIFHWVYKILCYSTFYKFELFEAFTIRWFIRIIHFSFMEFVHYLYGYIFKKTQKPFKCNNRANAKNSLCKKLWTIFIRKQWTVLINAKNRFYECSKKIWIYSKHDVQSANFINVEIDFINAEK